jgi:CAAX prenyl protease-like protein
VNRVRPRGASPRVIPFAVFIAFIAVQPLVESALDPRWWVAIRGVACAALLLYFARSYIELRQRPTWRDSLLAIAVGLVVFALWITFDSGWATVGQPGAGFDPTRADGSLDIPLVALRIFGTALAVPVMEELFWRSFLMRRIDARDFLSLDPRAVSALAFGLSCALFASEHALWFAGLLAGVAYGLLYRRCRNLWIPIVSHATTNGTLAIWILATRNWQLW